MSLFIIGIVEMYLVTLWTKSVSKTLIVASGLITMANVLVWYYVLERIVSDLDNVYIVIGYALGCAAGTVLALGQYKMLIGKKAN